MLVESGSKKVLCLWVLASFSHGQRAAGRRELDDDSVHRKKSEQRVVVFAQKHYRNAILAKDTVYVPIS